MEVKDNNAIKILFSDDEEIIRKVFTVQLENRGFKVETAADGAEALKRITNRSAEYELVMVDVEMPVMDGFELIEKLREDYDKTELPIIVVTASPYSERVVKALRLGANDFISKSNDFEVIEARINTQISLKRAAEQVRLYLKETNQINVNQQKELDMASKILEKLLPVSCPETDNYQFGLGRRMTSKIGGDFYNFKQYENNGKILVYLADAVGHGVPAALLSALFISQAELFFRQPEKLSRALSELNRRLFQILPGGRFISAFFLLLDPANGTIEYFKCGQEPALLVKPDGQVEKLETEGVLLGAFPGEMLDSSEAFKAGKRTVEPGSKIILYTDGLIDATAADGEPFGVKKFYWVVEKLKDVEAQLFADKILDSIERYTESTKFEDDLTLIVIDVN